MTTKARTTAAKPTQNATLQPSFIPALLCCLCVPPRLLNCEGRSRLFRSLTGLFILDVWLGYGMRGVNHRISFRLFFGGPLLEQRPPAFMELSSGLNL